MVHVADSTCMNVNKPSYLKVTHIQCSLIKITLWNDAQPIGAVRFLKNSISAFEEFFMPTFAAPAGGWIFINSARKKTNFGQNVYPKQHYFVKPFENWLQAKKYIRLCDSPTKNTCVWFFLQLLPSHLRRLVWLWICLPFL